MKRKCNTAQMLTILSRHHNWTAKAPDAATKLPERCYYACDCFRFEFRDVSGEWVTNNVSVIPDRDDWEIVRPKRKGVTVGRVSFKNGFIDKYRFNAEKLDKSKTYKLVAVEM